MYYAIKGSKQMKIRQEQISAYAALGYDVFDIYSAPVPAPKPVPYEHYEALLAENQALKAQLDGVKKPVKAAKEPLQKEE